MNHVWSKWGTAHTCWNCNAQDTMASYSLFLVSFEQRDEIIIGDNIYNIEPQQWPMQSCNYRADPYLKQTTASGSKKHRTAPKPESTLTPETTKSSPCKHSWSMASEHCHIQAFLSSTDRHCCSKSLPAAESYLSSPKQQNRGSLSPPLFLSAHNDFGSPHR